MNRLLALPVALLFLLTACGGAENDLVLYSGRSQALVAPLIAQFEDETGLRVGVRYGDTAQLAVALAEEGEQARADVFWGQDAGGLGAVHAEGLLAALPDSILQQVDAAYANEAGTWVAASGRARTLVYTPSRVDTTALPESIFDLTDEAYRGRVGWAPTNGSFQSHLTAMRRVAGDDSTRAWIRAMADANTQSYPRNSAIVQAVASGEVDFGLANHYYLYRFLSEDPNFPVAQAFFAPGDAGNLVNVAGVGVLSTSERTDAALRFVDFLLSPAAQRYIVEEVFEYPVIAGVETADAVVQLEDLEGLQPQLDLDDLRDLQETLDMLRAEGLL